METKTKVFALIRIDCPKCGHALHPNHNDNGNRVVMCLNRPCEAFQFAYEHPTIELTATRCIAGVLGCRHSEEGHTMADHSTTLMEATPIWLAEEKGWIEPIAEGQWKG